MASDDLDAGRGDLGHDQDELARLSAELGTSRQREAALQSQVTALAEVLRATASSPTSLDIHEVLATIVANATRLSESDGGSLYEYDEATETLLPSGPLPPHVPDDLDEAVTRTVRSRRIRVGEGAVGRAVATRGPVEIPDILVPGSYDSPIRDTLVEAGFRSLLAIPLLRQDRPLGARVVVRRTPGRFSPEVTALLQTFAGQCALAIHNARLYQTLEAQGRPARGGPATERDDDGEDPAGRGQRDEPGRRPERRLTPSDLTLALGMVRDEARVFHAHGQPAVVRRAAPGRQSVAARHDRAGARRRAPWLPFSLAA